MTNCVLWQRQHEPYLVPVQRLMAGLIMINGVSWQRQHEPCLVPVQRLMAGLNMINGVLWQRQHEPCLVPVQRLMAGLSGMSGALEAETAWSHVSLLCSGSWLSLSHARCTCGTDVCQAPPLWARMMDKLSMSIR